MRTLNRHHVVSVPAALVTFFALTTATLAQESAAPTAQAAPAAQATSASADAAPTESSWPRMLTVDNNQLTVYPPSFQSWDGTTLTGTCAFSLAAAGSKTQTYGTLSFTASTEVNKLNRMVAVSNILVTGVSLPSNPANQNAIMSAISSKGTGASLSISLDRLEAAVPSMTSAPSVATAPLQNTPPTISIVTAPTVLVPIQGAPVTQPIQGTDCNRVINTPMLLVQDASGAYWLKIADGWMTCQTLTGAWAVGQASDSGLAAALKWAQSQPTINLLAPTPPASSSSGSADSSQSVSLSSSAPAIVVSTTPTEVLVVNGPPQWTAVGASGLLAVSNTSANIFQLQSSGAMYVLISGRWFTSPSLSGAWAFVPPEQLPTAFMMIPHDSPKENVLASIAGTAQAQEAAIANSIPQMARIPVSQAFAAPVIFGGTPLYVPIVGTTISAVSNCSLPVFMLGNNNYYAVQNGVWFFSTSLKGGWKVATWVPPLLYTIPASSPYYYVTYVKIYNTTPDYVLVGYTPGYMGAYVQGGVIVYGTGYAYVPYCSTVWVPVPATYGCCASMCYNPWGGWAFGFGMGMAVGWAIGANSWHCGPYPYWGPYYGAYGAHGAYAWGPGGWAATTGNVYHQYGNVSTMSRSSAGYNAWTGNAWGTHTATAYNSSTGARGAEQTGHVENAYTGNWAAGARGAGYNPTTGNYAAGKGGVAGTPSGATVAAGAGTIGNTKTGSSVSAAGVTTANGTWGVAKGDNGAAVATGNNVYGYHDGSAYKYDDSTNSWQQAQKDGSWSTVNDPATTNALDQQQATRTDGDFRSAQSSRWQSGGSGFAGDGSDASDARNTSDGSANRSSGGGAWGSGGQNRSNSGSSNFGRAGRAGGFGGGRR